MLQPPWEYMRGGFVQCRREGVLPERKHIYGVTFLMALGSTFTIPCHEELF